MVRPLTIVNCKLDAWEVERIIRVRSGQSAGLGTRPTMFPAISRPCVPLTVHVGGASKIRSVHRKVPYLVKSVQTVSRSGTPGVPSCPPLGLATVLNTG